MPYEEHPMLPEHIIPQEYTPVFPDVSFFRESFVTMREENVSQGQDPPGEDRQGASQNNKKASRTPFSWLRNFLGSALRGGAVGKKGGNGLGDGALAAVGALDPSALSALNDAEKADKEDTSETKAILDDLDVELQAAGYRGEKSAYDLWADDELSTVLFRYGIGEPSLPDTKDTVFESAMAMFGAAMSIAEAAAANQTTEQE